MDMTIQEEIEQLVLRCIAADGLKACPKDISFLEKYRLKNLYFLSVRYRMEGTDCPELDRRAEGLIRWNIYSTDFPLLRRVYAREGKEGVDEMPVPGGGVFPQIPGTDRTGGEDMTSLSVVSYIERINRMYRLIRTESTGSRAELAGRMRVSERTVSNYLEELRLMGADIRFSKTRNTYYFFNRFVLYATFEARIDADVLDDKKKK